VILALLLTLAPPDSAETTPQSNDGAISISAPKSEQGAFFQEEKVSEVRHPAQLGGLPPPEDPARPVVAVARGRFCFVEDSGCLSALILDADVGVGVNALNQTVGLDVPYTQFRVRGGLTVRPMALGGKWHPWAIGLVGSWSLGSPPVQSYESDDAVIQEEGRPITAWRIAMINQLWFSHTRNAPHLDFSIGTVNSNVLDQGRYFGTHVDLGLGFAGWGGPFMAADFLDGDVRFVAGVRGHGILTGPLIGLVLLGMLAGGAL
jgi:hypothetical protein